MHGTDSRTQSAPTAMMPRSRKARGRHEKETLQTKKMKVTIRKGRPPLDRILRAAYKAQDELAKEALALYGQTVATFVHRPVFTIEEHVEKGGQKRRLNIYVRESGNINPRHSVRDNYIQLDLGFTRKVAMTRDFTPKTQPGDVFNPQIGTGGVFRKKNGALAIIVPKPVQPRSFTREIADQLRAKWRDKIKTIING